MSSIFRSLRKTILKSYQQIKVNKTDLLAQTELVKVRSVPESDMKKLIEDEEYVFLQDVSLFMTNLIYLFIMTSAFFFALEAYNFMIANDSQLKSIVKNWEQPYIEDIFVSNTTNTCPEGYDFLIKRKWPGTMYGCY
eukprot:CAMPEP_0168321636 /NCGR_PEP_ID=MMETSP0213-20121227/2400_1 /TAXON_ID=151035 /ORGANISM="Euplotes harpa, Strain FSP1.4" /LENGTH=136 /DNA_ID=CAMNT_0008323347 /DNA_START=8 /DNA_END=418 /DNA_ORIENTATION=+